MWKPRLGSSMVRRMVSLLDSSSTSSEARQFCGRFIPTSCRVLSIHRCSSSGTRNTNKGQSVTTSIPSSPTERVVKGGGHGAHGIKYRSNQPSSSDSLNIKILIDEVGRIEEKFAGLSELPVIYHASKMDYSVDPKRQHLLHDTRRLVQLVRRAEKEESIKPSNKHRREISIIFERILRLYSLSQSGENDERGSVFDSCRTIMQLMQDWGLSLNAIHGEYVMTVAAREERWQEGADIFLSMIDPRDAAYQPSGTSVANPIGLFVLACSAREQGVAVAEYVFDAVNQMIMISPMDAERSVLAAGVAIGYAGHWESLVEYLNSSMKAIDLGQPLVAATMRACLLCNRPLEALKVFNENLFVDGHHRREAREWAWAGGQESLHPLCRDLAMAALGSAPVESSELALEYMEATEKEGVSLSIEALLGVFNTLETEGKWERAVDLLFRVLRRDLSAPWLVYGEDMSIVDRGLIQAPTHELLRELAGALCATMRACNLAQQFGLSLLCFTLYDLKISDTLGLDPLGDNDMSLDLSRILPNSSNDLLITVMASLAGIDYHSKAIKLFDDTNGALSQPGSCSEAQKLRDVLIFKNRTSNSDFLRHPWELVESDVRKIELGLKNGHKLVDGTERLLGAALSYTIRAMTEMGHPKAALYFLKWLGDGNFEMHGHVPSLLDINAKSGGSPIAVNDALQASIILAHAADESSIGSSIPSETHELGFGYVSTSNAILRVLSASGDLKSVVSWFEKTVGSNRSPELFSLMARALINSGNPDDVGNVYGLGISCANNSDELSVAALEAVAMAKLEAKTKVMQNIVEEIARSTGVSPDDWIKRRCWYLRKKIGIRYLRNLLSWNGSKVEMDDVAFALAQLDTLDAPMSNRRAALRAIVRACKVQDQPKDSMTVHSGHRRIVPRSKEAWLEVLRRTIREAKTSSLMNEPGFIGDACVALARLGQESDCLALIREASSRDLLLSQNVVRKLHELVSTDGRLFQTIAPLSR